MPSKSLKEQLDTAKKEVERLEALLEEPKRLDSGFRVSSTGTVQALSTAEQARKYHETGLIFEYSYEAEHRAKQLLTYGQLRRKAIELNECWDGTANISNNGRYYLYYNGPCKRFDAGYISNHVPIDAIICKDKNTAEELVVWANEHVPTHALARQFS